MPGPLLALPLEDIPGVGSRMEQRLAQAGIRTIEQLWNSQPKHLRELEDAKHSKASRDLDGHRIEEGDR